ncbi:hypothetical protein Ava_D0025 [Trichormus variabilis ATCC 29413]|uniref:Uncharacterized protein n=2 Tax=Anabaena variabilis TaxID=264691 RepID=Q3M2U6_TRIV2|nr:hypothetical protein [Trichormus variabilis]ABA24690.1 hypothetical protein Ava_D0025 [Trichormus variabilis ATCC 29413]MBC1217727.1 hypothetical protein [Trichormus variabilis ARAD]MBC1258982.1 hypothetical protein [Trichormus variabilis V5]MBC1302693.1 hypothetical protein [Trichormus variabilis N2B]MBC1324548.1 hypothetical protein [Trichormus variabilis 9RC]
MPLVIDEAKGWASIQLTAAVCRRDSQKVSELSQKLTALYDDKEIQAIWKKVKLLLTQEDITWLETTLTELSQLQLAS